MDLRRIGGGVSQQQDDQLERAITPTISPEVKALLREMGVRNPVALAGVPGELLSHWQAIVCHPGMQARFSDPVAFAITQMKRGAEPPPANELERWAKGEQQRPDRYPSWRHIAPVEAPANDDGHAQLAERARALAPPGASALDVLDLFAFLAEGASQTEALERLAVKQAASEAQGSDEEVYRALIARTSRR